MKTQFIVSCAECGGNTNRKYAREHNGRCKQCADPDNYTPKTPTREQRILEHGYQAYAREEGHYE